MTPDVSPDGPVAYHADAPEDFEYLLLIDGVDGRTNQKLRHAGVITLRDLLDAEPKRIADKQDLSVEQIRRFQRLNGLLDVRNVGEKRGMRLLTAGIGSRQALADADPATIAERLDVSESQAQDLVDAAALEEE